MKKLIPLLLLLSACSISYAESMKFITVLSSPVGTFNKLEAVDPTSSAYGKTVNFCTSIGTQGVVELKGTKTANLNIVSLANNTTLGKTDRGKFSLNNITLKQGGSIKGGRLFGNTVTVNNAASGKANNLYGNQLTVAGAKTKTLDINSGASKITTQHAGADMVWSNEYQADDACKSGSACAKQYLLKEKGGVSSIKQYCYDFQVVSPEYCDYVQHPFDSWNYAKISSSGNWRDMDKNGAYWLTYGTDVECWDAPCAPSEEAASGGLYSDPHECCLQPCAEGQKWTCDKNENCVCAEPAKPVEWEAKEVKKVFAVCNEGLYIWNGPYYDRPESPYNCVQWTEAKYEGWDDFRYVYIWNGTETERQYQLNGIVGVNGSFNAYCTEQCKDAETCNVRLTAGLSLKAGHDRCYSYMDFNDKGYRGVTPLSCGSCYPSIPSNSGVNWPRELHDLNDSSVYCVGPSFFTMSIYQCVRKEN